MHTNTQTEIYTVNVLKGAYKVLHMVIMACYQQFVQIVNCFSESQAQNYKLF